MQSLIAKRTGVSILDQETGNDRTIGVAWDEIQTTLPFQTVAIKAKPYLGAFPIQK